MAPGYLSSLCQPVSRVPARHKNALYKFTVITVPSIWPVLFCSLASDVCRRRLLSVTLPAAERVAVGRPTLHGGPVRLRLVRAKPCYYKGLQFSDAKNRHKILLRSSKRQIYV